MTSEDLIEFYTQHDSIKEKSKDKEMKKHWVLASKNFMTTYDTVDAAVAKAKIKSAKDQSEYIVYEAVQATVTPVPAIEMITL